MKWDKNCSERWTFHHFMPINRLFTAHCTGHGHTGGITVKRHTEQRTKDNGFVKGHVLGCKRPCFSTQKAAFQKIKDGLLQRIDYLTVTEVILTRTKKYANQPCCEYFLR
ncbi:unknown [Prevotella sp. CAG:1185]|nr:unknown [Prevotella sp. CAG:1185]